MDFLLLMKRFMIAALQITGLWLIYAVSSLIADTFSLPIPAGVIGMIILFALLTSKVLPLRWVDTGGGLLLDHLPLLFIPVAVGLMPFGDLFLSNWLSMLIVILASTGIGIFIAGATTQMLKKHKEQKGENQHANSDHSL